MKTVLVVYLVALAIAISSAFFVQEFEWSNYKALYGKFYHSNSLESIRRFNFAFNNYRKKHHNWRYQNNLETYDVDINQYSDLTVREVAALFPTTLQFISNAVPYTPPAVPPQDSFSYTTQGFVSPVENQGYVCNSGWAYATATALKIYDASITANLNSLPISAQVFIDCAGGATACSNQVPQTAFNYMTKQFQRFYTQTEYPNNPLGVQGMCVLPVTSTTGKTLRSYASIPDGNDELLKSALNYVAPVVIKINPATFEYIHYKKGLFTQPRSIQDAAHFMVIVGYEPAKGTRKGFWLAQNSFGRNWGENGMMRIESNSAKPIANSAVFPLE